MTLKEKIERALATINPRLEELADGYVELMELDEARGILVIKSFGGRLH
jgi:hypothetical protein